tara:strand:+ start:615 stop:1472 length:858 start_codon:yes stop_codon:yes gene_type:complete
MAIVGSGKYKYELIRPWPNIPKYWVLGECTDSAVNSKGEVHIFSRGKHPLTIWDASGNFISSWGEGLFKSPHGIFIDNEDQIWLVDTLDHVVTKHEPNGNLILTLGQRGLPAYSFQGLPFNMPSGIALAPNGEIFVSDGYGGHRVHRFTSTGNLLLSWGKEGNGLGEFVNLHNIGVDKLGRVYICDRENDRIQIFDNDGNYLQQWDIIEPNDLFIQDELIYVASDKTWISIWDLKGENLARFGGNESAPSKPIMESVHGISVDNQGSIFITETVVNGRVTKLQRL